MKITASKLNMKMNKISKVNLNFKDKNVFDLKIGIAGFGVVGQAFFSSIKHENINLFIYDKYKNIGDENDLIHCDVVFCFLPTPTRSKKQSIEEIRNLLSYLHNNNFKGIFIIRSTVLYYVQFEDGTYDFDIVINPEFLRQNHVEEDIKNTTDYILGGRIDVCKNVQIIYELLGIHAKFHFVTMEEACDIKYIHNIYRALIVTFHHYVHDVTINQSKIWGKIKEMMIHEDYGSNIYMDGKPGFGGACLPKDVVSYDHECPHNLTKFLINKTLYI